MLLDAVPSFTVMLTSRVPGVALVALNCTWCRACSHCASVAVAPAEVSVSTPVPGSKPEDTILPGSAPDTANRSPA